MEIKCALETPRRSGDSSCPEFEFWMVGNPSCPQPDLLTADELFVDGVLLPLHLLSFQQPEPNLNPEPKTEPVPEPDPPPAAPFTEHASICSAAPATGSKRWKDLFKVGEKKAEEKEKKKERKNSAGGSAELNINIWPFSRSRSAGNGGAGSRPRASAMAGRKASSAPCSRSNSRGESTKQPSPATAGGRRWAASPSRAGLGGGVHLSRTSPVWQVKRTGKGTEPVSRGAGGGAKRASGRKGSGGGGVRVLNLNVNTCIGYRNQVRNCRGDDNEGVTCGVRTGDGGGSNGASLFSFRSLFSSKKVY